MAPLKIEIKDKSQQNITDSKNKPNTKNFSTALQRLKPKKTRNELTINEPNQTQQTIRPKIHNPPHTTQKQKLGQKNTPRIYKKTWWEMMDSNHRSRTTTDLQSAPFGHSGNLP